MSKTALYPMSHPYISNLSRGCFCFGCWLCYHHHHHGRITLGMRGCWPHELPFSMPDIWIINLQRTHLRLPVMKCDSTNEQTLLFRSLIARITSSHHSFTTARCIVLQPVSPTFGQHHHACMSVCTAYVLSVNPSCSSVPIISTIFMCILAPHPQNGVETRVTATKLSQNGWRRGAHLLFREIRGTTVLVCRQYHAPAPEDIRPPSCWSFTSTLCGCILFVRKNYQIALR